ncbi:polymeric immunoglobulin receptor-like isoform X2 [Hippocampus zosterae]|uniref:polymeric immunoglobulin receptor-like isoform X2 n=1 Tax=Hippocampus zosterae TaxID=109293 RepID=UPI00223DAF6B|nr:polymeric immunoglobulin receptor-like isoform X2 [Hippocampus zosterae]
MMQVSHLLLSLLPWIPGLVCGLMTEDQFTVQEGKSLILPCHYEPQYASNVKYWCRGKMREFCTSLARTDDSLLESKSEDKVTVFDDPEERVFTVTMKNLTEEDSGWYMCGVELGGFWEADVRAFTYVEVSSGIFVVNDRLSEEEGGAVKVQCLYSPKYRESEKKWCRIGNPNSCLATDDEGSYEDVSVAITDDKTGTFTVTIKKLQMSDKGWYRCVVGPKQRTVHVQVLPRPSTTAAASTTNSLAAAKPSVADADAPKRRLTNDCCVRQSLNGQSVVMFASFMLLAALTILATRMWKRKEFAKLRQTMGMKARNKDDFGIVTCKKNPAVFVTVDPMDAQAH